ncbi:hypothetical protein BZM27_02990 [Paraburkholderia steynii]|uniref:Uncharacterized protein n=1 Tax=Paraburkholderia steynii TaxID=1245441 RepID=A0A4V2NHR4_9BURK|nr:hypothetical protein BZM27_02990 [Paraburkholderia steynii]
MKASGVGLPSASRPGADKPEPRAEAQGQQRFERQGLALRGCSSAHFSRRSTISSSIWRCPRSTRA